MHLLDSVIFSLHDGMTVAEMQAVAGSVSSLWVERMQEGAPCASATRTAVRGCAARGGRACAISPVRRSLVV